jgi:predicted unusual protein kinase regulating ubiquinone biosynthesis (AarF/ABC1/UbiB family)
MMKESLLFHRPSALSDERSETRSRFGHVLRLARIALLSTAFAITSFSPRAWAITTIRHSISSIQSAVPWKSILKTALAVWTVRLAYSNYQVKKRQANLATSEWSRYARYPGARGRTILWLTVQQAILILASQIVRTRRSAIRQHAGHHFADSLLKLGPLYIKLGQIMSCRKNLLGPEWIEAMATLQDKVPANTGQDALDLAYTTLEGGKEEFDELFSDFDSMPLAAASLGQVHKATLRSNGDVVAVKVQRPFLRKIYDQDLEFLTAVAQWMDKMPSASKNVGGVASSWTDIFEDAGEILYREIDYRDEASNGVRFCEDFGLTRGGNPAPSKAKSRNNQTLPSAADWIRVPYVYQNISSERLLVMEFVPSIKVTNKAKLEAANVTATDQIDLADALARAYLRQFCCNLFFSTDPHPGKPHEERVVDL